MRKCNAASAAAARARWIRSTAEFSIRVGQQTMSRRPGAVAELVQCARSTRKRCRPAKLGAVRSISGSGMVQGRDHRAAGRGAGDRQRRRQALACVRVLRRRHVTDCADAPSRLLPDFAVSAADEEHALPSNPRVCPCPQRRPLRLAMFLSRLRLAEALVASQHPHRPQQQPFDLLTLVFGRTA